MVLGGFEETSYTTRFTPLTSLMILLEIRSSRSYGRRAQSAVMASTLSTQRRAMTCSYVRPVAHDAHRLQREQHGEALPNLTIPAGITQFLLHDGVGLAEDIQPLTGHFADYADGEAGTGERLTPG